VSHAHIHRRGKYKKKLTVGNRALTFLSNLGSPKKLVLYNALIGICWGVGAILGPIVGGAFSDSSATWRWVRYQYHPCDQAVEC
jgi:hypothetical protein